MYRRMASLFGTALGLRYGRRDTVLGHNPPAPQQPDEEPGYYYKPTRRSRRRRIARRAGNYVSKYHWSRAKKRRAMAKASRRANRGR